jgi:hypothetical protein
MPKITEMFAFICEDKGPNDERVVALAGADMARVNALKPYALDIAKKTGKKVKLIHFTNREDLEEIG